MPAAPTRRPPAALRSPRRTCFPSRCCLVRLWPRRWSFQARCSAASVGERCLALQGGSEKGVTLAEKVAAPAELPEKKPKERKDGLDHRIPAASEQHLAACASAIRLLIKAAAGAPSGDASTALTHLRSVGMLCRTVLQGNPCANARLGPLEAAAMSLPGVQALAA